ncbi:MAG: adenosylcobinamide-GDP ribazoletransferase, partial [Rhodanobacter sp.]
MISGLLAALGFLTRIPVPVKVFDDARAQSQSLAWYPLVGLVLGLILAALAWALHEVPPLLSAALLLLVWVGLTGAMHLDGLADSADAWVGGLGNRARTLEIMKDPRSGPVGVVAVVLVLLLKFAALASLPATDWVALLLAPVLARATLTAAFLSTPYVRSGGLGTALVAAPRRACLAALLGVVALCLWLPGWRGVVVWLVAALVFMVWRHTCLQRLGGMTGDPCGALTELIEA